jgi:hypothetical protein
LLKVDQIWHIKCHRLKSRRDDDTGKQLGHFGQKALGLALSSRGQQWSYSKGMRHGREIVAPSYEETPILWGS